MMKRPGPIRISLLLGAALLHLLAGLPFVQVNLGWTLDPPAASRANVATDALVEDPCPHEHSDTPPGNDSGTCIGHALCCYAHASCALPFLPELTVTSAIKPPITTQAIFISSFLLPELPPPRPLSPSV